MRTQLCIALAIGMWFATSAVQAQTYDPAYPVCMHVFSGPGGGDFFSCRFASLAQCRASASGRAAMCDVNPYYRGGSRHIGPRRHHRHHHHSRH